MLNRLVNISISRATTLYELAPACVYMFTVFTYKQLYLYYLTPFPKVEPKASNEKVEPKASNEKVEWNFAQLFSKVVLKVELLKQLNIIIHWFIAHRRSCNDEIFYLFCHVNVHPQLRRHAKRD